MAMPLTNAEFAADLAALLALNETQTAALPVLLDRWAQGGAGVAVAAGRSAATNEALNTFLQQAIAWYATPANGGPLEDGRAPLTDSVGNTYLVASPAAVAAAGVQGVSGYALIADLPDLSSEEAGWLAKVEEDQKVYRWSGAAWLEFDDPTLSASAAAIAAAATAGAAAASVAGVIDTDRLDFDHLALFLDAVGRAYGSVDVHGDWDIRLKALRQADGFTMTLFETLDTAVGYGVLLDPSGRILAQFPDPAVANLAATSTTAVFYETLDVTASVIFLDKNGRLLGRLGASATQDALLSEVETARGSAASLGARLNTALYPNGMPRRPFGVGRLRQFHYRKAKRTMATPEAVQNSIGFIGDSFTHNASRYSGPLAERWIADQGDAGGGWTGFGFGSDGAPPYALGGGQPGLINGNVRSVYGVAYVGSWAKTYALSPSPDICHVTSATAGDRIKASFPATPVLSGCRLFWIGTANGVVRYSWDNGSSWTDLNVQGPIGDCSFADLAGAPTSGAGFLLIEVVSGTCSLAGVDWRSAASGARVHKLGATGSRLQQWATQAANASWRAAIAALGINTIQIMHGTNDQGSSRHPTQFAADMTTVVGALKTAVPSIDVAIVMPPENQRGQTVKMKDLAEAATAVALASGAAFYDTQADFGDPDNPTEYGATGATPLFSVDTIHPEPLTGGRLLVSAHLRFYEAL